jgi:hypothetical protein
MIVTNQSNLKVHFAAAENNNHFCELKTGGANYLLFTVFPLICQKFGIKTVPYGNEITNTAKKVYENSNHCIMDSGLFTLMFGSHKGQKDEKFINKWYNELIGYVSDRGYKGTCVEVDCQKVLGVEKAWEFRQRMRNDLPNNRIINVFHKEDGQKGLDRMIEFSDYIAISVPELRFLGQKNYTEYLAHYIKNKKPSIDIHLLGCTELKLLKNLSFCSSSDSTSWNSGVRYGLITLSNGKKGHISKLKKEHYIPFMDQVERLHLETGVKMPNKNRSSILSFQVNQLIKLYSNYAGNQD